MNKRRILEKIIANNGICPINCTNICPYFIEGCIINRLKKIGAMAILRQNRPTAKATLDIGTKIRFFDGRVATLCLCAGNIMLEFKNEKDKYYQPIEYLVGSSWELANE